MENETIYESLHRHFEDEKQEKRQEGLQEGREEERTSILNTMKTLENEGKTLSEAINILQSNIREI